jgi:diaminopimelate decarboxylase
MPDTPLFPTLPGRPFFHYTEGQMWAEGVPLQSLAQAHGTPLFVYSEAAMLAALQAYQQAFAGRQALVCYAMKANSTLAILQTFVRAGCGLDIVSGGELERALRAGVSPDRVIFSGVGKSRTDMRRALAVGIGCFNVESVAELDVLNEVALSMGLVAPISLRVNPDVDAKTHPYISTGLKGNKFGIAHTEALDVYRRAARLPGLRVQGIDCHIGSQITETAPFLDAMDRVLDLVDTLESHGIALSHIDFGGGLGIEYQGDTPPQADALWAALLGRIDARGHSGKALVIEPGRSLIGNAGVCLTEVLYDKAADAKHFLIVDAAMNDLPRPAMYEAYHAIVPVVPRAGAGRVYDVVGPVCESGDWLGRDRALQVSAGDLLAVCSAGAYCMSMSSNYNTRGRAAEVLVRGDRAEPIRARETAQDQMRGETLLNDAAEAAQP